MDSSKLIPGWTAPAAPRRFPALTAVWFATLFGGEWHLDYSRLEESQPTGRLFASDADACPSIDWPWQEGFMPTNADWADLGFTTLIIEDLSGGIRHVSPRERFVINAFLFDSELDRLGCLHSPGHA